MNRICFESETMTEKITEKIDGQESSLSSYSDNDSFLPLKLKIFQHFGRKNIHKVLGRGKCELGGKTGMTTGG